MNSSHNPNEVPGYKKNPLTAGFFIIFVIFAAFFIINLFIGVIISAYNREIEK
jgi:hypothetical protein